MKKQTFKTQVTIGVIFSFLVILFSALYFFNKLDSNTSRRNKLIAEIQQKFDAIDRLKIETTHASDEKLHYILNRETSDLAILMDIQEQCNALLDSIKKPIGSFGIEQNSLIKLEKEINNFVNPPNFKEDVNINSSQVLEQHIRVQSSLINHMSAISLDLVSQRKNKLFELEQDLQDTRYFTYISISIGLGFIIFLFLRIVAVFKILRFTIATAQQSNLELTELSEKIERTNTLLKKISEFDNNIRGDLKEKELATVALDSYIKISNSIAATLYMEDDDSQTYKLQAAQGLAEESQLSTYIQADHGVFQEVIASKEIKYIPNVRSQSLITKSSLTDQFTTDIYIIPLVYETKSIGFIELVTKIEPEKISLFKEFFQKAGSSLAVAFTVAKAHRKMSELFEELQQQTEELEAQQEELRTTNEELVYKTNLLEASEEELRVQQEELSQSNAELEEKAQLLSQQNADLEKARFSIADKIREVEQASKYKSEFMANMSHELRTPLNSILILAKLLQDNKQANLFDDQIKYARVIHSAGTDLLHLINELLDLAKIESGNVEVEKDTIHLQVFSDEVRELFKTTAEEKQIDFEISIDAEVPEKIISDEYRVAQVLKNLLSNAFKFTPSKGKVTLAIIRQGDYLTFQVSDTGIGIAEEKQALIFEAFKQEDGSTSRKYGGTGLGLSICREIANLLGGHISLKSEQQVGSTFSISLPLVTALPVLQNEKNVLAPEMAPMKPIKTALTVDQPLLKKVNKGASNLLIIEDDINFAEILKQYAEENGFTTFLCHKGDEGLLKAQTMIPDAIILDVMLPNMDGWTILKKLKADPNTKDIPVHMMSAATFTKTESLQEGAIGFLRKPISEEALEEVFSRIKEMINVPLKRVLLIEDHELQSEFIKSSLNEQHTLVDQAFDAKSALEILKENPSYDCIILDIHLPDKSGMELLDEIKSMEAYKNVPIIINTAMELTSENTHQILQHSQAMVLKSGKSNDRLIDEVNLFLNRIKEDENKLTHKAVNQTEINLELVLKGKNILLADDDMRNVFALSTAFESYNMNIEIANNGLEALQILEDNSQIDLILMDIMMPEMDGFEAITHIRAQSKYQKLPIIAVTAKAMKGDREKALEVGANDYISKPIELEKLISLMRVWLS
ncbi:response regulator [Sphingobacteriaceae bacterium WQ 2009]|uniref:histidine kinase n=1 Tax=Rhinopithecimicrobium faecis TaxID=2820698 RepID=A0A8T4H7P3_9SPHI|nr:response regulator [Sphingobacteriaceae bacterium WQ 2009]